MTSVAKPNERPILFSGPMVRAILEGRKTQTRRVIQPQSNLTSCQFDDMGWELVEDERKNYSAYFKLPEASWVATDEPTWRRIKSQYGEPGDSLWVRETFAYCSGDVYAYRADFHDAGSESTATVNMETGETAPLKWRPSIHMPRAASRITLEIISVQVERLQDIGQEDACAEGVGWWKFSGKEKDYLPEFRSLWDSINASRGFGWDVNPWVWVIEFKKATK